MALGYWYWDLALVLVLGPGHGIPWGDPTWPCPPWVHPCTARSLPVLPWRADTGLKVSRGLIIRAESVSNGPKCLFWTDYLPLGCLYKPLLQEPT